MSEFWPWLAIVLLGAFHGINPAMGWLFAVALGLQEQKRKAVLMSLVPITLGHALSVAVIVLAVGFLGRVADPRLLKVGAAGVLISFGLYKIMRSSHPRWGGMQVGWGDLTIWSFLMASAHGAGLMLVPVILGWPSAYAANSANGAPDKIQVGGSSLSSDALCEPSDSADPELAQRAGLATGPATDDEPNDHAEHLGAIAQAARGTLELGLLAVTVHTLAYLVTTAGIAVLVYDKLGLALLRRAWWNLDLLWAFALVATGLITLAV